MKTRTPQTALVEEAGTNFTTALTTIQNSNLSRDIKDVAQMAGLYAQTEVAIHSNNINAARTKAEQYRVQATARNNPVLLQNAHYLSGLVALNEKRYNDALTEFNQSDIRNPRILLKLAEVSEAMGNSAKAKELRQKVANFNESSFDFALVRWIAQQ